MPVHSFCKERGGNITVVTHVAPMCDSIAHQHLKSDRSLLQNNFCYTLTFLYNTANMHDIQGSHGRLQEISGVSASGVVFCQTPATHLWHCGNVAGVIWSQMAYVYGLWLMNSTATFCSG